MVFPAEAVSRPSETATATAALLAPPQPAPANIHRFSFPILKTWGSQRVLRCMSMDGNGEKGGGGTGGRRASEAAGDGIHAPEERGGDDGGIEEVGEKLLVHLRVASNRMKLVVPPPPGTGKTESEAEADAEPSSSSAPRAWKLRTRRRGPRAPSGFEGHTSAAPAVEKRPVRLRFGSTERRERPRFSLTLTREEIEEDIYAVTGRRARRQPRRRLRVVQKQLDLLFPGSWLSEITMDTYKVPD